MKKTILEIYAFAVCFVSLLCAAISLGVALFSTLKIFKPDLTLDTGKYETHYTNTTFCDNYSYRDECKDKTAIESNATVAKVREARLNEHLRTESRSGLQELIKEAIVIIIGLLIFLIHWRLARHARSTSQ